MKLLPPAWRTIYELTKLDDSTFGLALESGTINPNMGQYDAAKRDPRIESPADVDTQAHSPG